MIFALLCLASMLLLPGNSILHFGLLAFAVPDWRMKWTPTRKLAVGIVAWAFVCSIMATNMWTAILGSFVRMEGWIFWLAMARAAWIYWSHEDSVESLQWMLLGCIATLGVWSMFVRGSPIEKIALGGFCAVSAPILVSMSPLFMPILIPFVAASGSRASACAVAAGCLSYYLLSAKRKILPMLATLLLCVVGAAAMWPKFKSIDPSTLGLGARSSWIVQSMEISKRHPVFGVGPDNIMFHLSNPVGLMSPNLVPDRTHNIGMDILLQLGWPGYIATLSLLAMLLHTTLKSRTPSNCALMSCIAAYIVFGLMNPPGLFCHAMAVLSAIGISRVDTGRMGVV